MGSGAGGPTHPTRRDPAGGGTLNPAPAVRPAPGPPPDARRPMPADRPPTAPATPATGPASDPENPPPEFHAAVRAVLERAAAERQPWLLELVSTVADAAEDFEDAALLAAVKAVEHEGTVPA